MMGRVRSIVAGALAMLVIPLAPAATITLVPGAGFNDTTPATPEGGNSGTTLGQQRTILFNAAAAVWAAKLSSNQTIAIDARFVMLDCDAGGGVLGSAGATSFVTLGSGQQERFFPIALAESIEGENLNDGEAEIDAEFNARIDLADTGCIGNTRWYYGLTGPVPAGTIALFPTVLHELGHGLGFLTLLCTTPGGCTEPSTPRGGYFFGIPDIWSEFLRDNNGSNEYWVDMSNAERVASFTNDPRLVWDGPMVNARLASFGQGGSALDEDRLRMYAPSAFEPGSSLSHFHEAASPNLLMEPIADADVFNRTDLTDCLFGDIGWEQSGCVVNTAPALNPARSPQLAAVVEDAPAPSGAVGTLVSALVDFASPAGQVDNVTDPDAGALLGIAVVGVDSANGSAFYSLDNGGSWNALGAVSPASARLLPADANARVHFRPQANFNGTLGTALTFRAWDRSSGSAGALVSTSPNGGITAFSAATDTASIVVTPTNDAPVLDASRTPVMTAVAEDAPAPVGAVGTPVTVLADLVPPTGGLDNVSDPDTGAETGIAITTAATANGAWFFSLDSGGTWTSLGAVSNTNARLLPATATARVYFQPNPDFDGVIASALSFRAWDRSSGTAGAQASTATNGGNSAFSSATDSANLVVTAVNEAPVLDPSRTPFLADVPQNAPAPGIGAGTLVSALIDPVVPAGQLDNVSDAEADTLFGIAVIGLDTGNGQWRFTLDGGASWLPLSVTPATARLLAADIGTRVHFQPNPGFAGTASLTLRAWDRSSGANGGIADASVGGGTSAFSAAQDEARVSVIPAVPSLFRDGFESP